jgi:hypothetical protein
MVQVQVQLHLKLLPNFSKPRDGLRVIFEEVDGDRIIFYHLSIPIQTTQHPANFLDLSFLLQFFAAS